MLTFFISTETLNQQRMKLLQVWKICVIISFLMAKKKGYVESKEMYLGRLYGCKLFHVPLENFVINIIREGFQNLSLSRAHMTLAQGSLSCYTYWDKVPRFKRPHPRDCPI